MRTAFVETLSELAHEDRRINLITGDLGFGVLENFRKDFPMQYLNPGVAEQNMAGLAAGLAAARFQRLRSIRLPKRAFILPMDIQATEHARRHAPHC